MHGLCSSCASGPRNRFLHPAFTWFPHCCSSSRACVLLLGLVLLSSCYPETFGSHSGYRFKQKIEDGEGCPFRILLMVFSDFISLQVALWCGGRAAAAKDVGISKCCQALPTAAQSRAFVLRFVKDPEVVSFTAGSAMVRCRVRNSGFRLVQCAVTQWACSGTSDL